MHTTRPQNMRAAFPLIALCMLFGSMFFISASPTHAQTQITYGSVLTESISTQGEIDRFTFEGTQGEFVLARMSELSGGGFFVDKLEVLAPDGSSLIVGSNGAQVELRFELPSSGVYTILASDNDIHTGSYTLFLQRLSDPVGCTSLSYGDIIPDGSISTAGLIQCYQFEGEEGEPILARMSERGGGGFFVDKLEILNPDGSRLDVASNGAIVERRVTLPETGTYVILAGDNDIHTGSYTLFLQRLVDPVGCTSLGYGDIIPDGSISTAGLIQCYEFEGEEGEPILARMSERGGGGFFVDKLEILNPDGSRLDVASNGAIVERRVTLPETGTYVILAGDNDIHTGSYTLFLQRLVRPVGATPLVYGDIARDTVAVAGYIKSYVFSGCKDDLIILRMSEISGGGFFVDKLELLGPDASRIVVGTNGASVELRVTLPETGEYVILAGDNDIHTGVFTVALVPITVKQKLTVSPTSLDFGELPVGTTARETVSLTNPTSDTARVSHSLEGPDAAQFELTESESTLLPGESKDVGITFTPDSEGNFEAFIQFESSLGTAQTTLKGRGEPSDTSDTFFTATLIVEDTDASRLFLDFGTHAEASSGYDSGLDELLPPVPPKGVFDGRFLGSPFDLIRDIRGPIDSLIVWNVQAQPASEGDPITFKWDSGQFPEEGRFRFQDADRRGAVNIDMRSDSMYVNTLGLSNFLITYSLSEEDELPLDVAQGWNLIGIPVADAHVDIKDVFPGIQNGSVFTFEDRYVMPDPSGLVAGKGYWVYANEADTAFVHGRVIRDLTVALNPGWNLISGPSCTISSSNVLDPDGRIIPGTLFGYENGYVSANALIPGKGYWINAESGGDVVFDCSVKNSSVEFVVSGESEHMQHMGHLQVSTSAGDQMILYFGDTQAMQGSEESFSLPPVPPSGAFDARFAGDTRMSFEQDSPLQWQGAQESVYVKVLKAPATGMYFLKEVDREGVVSTHHLTAGTHFTFDAEDEVSLQTSINTSIDDRIDGIPSAFSLGRNYPNPFNPSTTISFEVPTASHVSLTVYDVMGRKVRTLVNGELSAGVHERTWDATSSDGASVSSGMYFYVLTAEAHNYKATGRMMLIK